MKKYLIWTALLFLQVFLFKSFTSAATFNIANGDVAALINAINASNANNEDDIINLANNGLYVFSNSAGIADDDGTSKGAIGLPAIKKFAVLVINGNGSILRRNASASQFRILYTMSWANLTLNNLTIENSSTTFDGGALFTGYKSKTLIKNCKFINNNSGEQGGAIYIKSLSETTIEGTEFRNNICKKNGGGVYSLLSNLSIDNCKFFNNRCTNTTTSDSQGGGVFTDCARGDFGTISITNSHFEGNEGRHFGGAAYIYTCNSNRTIVDKCTFRANKAIGINNEEVGFGGGFGFDTGIATIPDNEYPFTGGSDNTNLTISNSLFHENNAVGLGAGLCLGGTGQIKITNCTLTKNRAEKANLAGKTDGSGGGIAFLYAGRFQIINCTIVDNYAGHMGGGIHTESNQGLSIYNSIIAFNRANNSGNNWSLHHNCRYNYQGSNNIQFPDLTNSNNYYCTPSITVVDPAVSALANNGGPTATIALSANSPAINRGSTNFCPSTDQRGVGRMGTCDIGAFEYNPASLPPPPNDSTLTGLLTNIEESKYIQFYPNPSKRTDELKTMQDPVELFSSEANLIITSIGGQVLTDKFIEPQNLEKELNEEKRKLFAGLYFIRIKGANKTFFSKLVIQ